MIRATRFAVLAALLTACGTQADNATLNPAEGSQMRVADPLADEVGQRYIIVFKDSIRGLAAVNAAGGHVALALPRQDAVAAYLPAAAVAGLSNNPNIALVEHDVVRVPFAETVPYGITQTQSDLLSDVSDPDGVTVCIIDSGFQASHEDLAGNPNVTASPDIGTGDPLVDTCGHGTHVAGTIAATGGNDVGVVGVNPNGDQNMHIVKVFGGADCAWSYSSTLVKALDECRASTDGKLVVSMSLGGTFKSRTEQKAFDAAWDAGVLSIAAAGNDGNTRKSFPASYDSVMSVAAVDDAMVIADFSQQNDQVEIAAPGVGVLSTVPWSSNQSLTVAGVTYQGNALEGASETSGVNGAVGDGGLCDAPLAAGSHAGEIVLCERGAVSFLEKVQNAAAGGAAGVVLYNNAPGNFFGTLGGEYPSLPAAITISQEDGQLLVASALGQSGDLVSEIDSNGSGYEAWNGTSMATPHVSGIAALVWENAPSASNADIRDALNATALDLGVAGRDNAFGHGLVQALDAFDYIGSGPTCTPTENTESSCADGIDNDCDGFVDDVDTDCDLGGGDPGTCDLADVGEACTVDGDCCTNNCKGRRGAKTCK